MSTQDDRPLLTLLSLATNAERARLVRELADRGFDDVALAGARLIATVAAGPKSIQALAEATETTKQFTAREVRKLVAARYVATAPSPEDGRVTLVRIEPRGRKLLDASREAKRALDADAAKKLGARELSTLRKLLARLVDG